jgi:catechol 2,3-dioxygenase-like lactoylglutathione lyase family enzyme
MKLIEIAKFTDDVAGMTAFYRHLLGAEPIAESHDMAIFMSGETKIFIHQMYQPGEDDLQPENHIAFEVEDVDEKCAELQAHKLTLEVSPRDYYWGRSAYLRDPDGNLIEITKTQK